MPLFDTHAHYNDDAFDQNRKGLLDALTESTAIYGFVTALIMIFTLK